MELIDAKAIVQLGVPEEEGARLACALLERKVDLVSSIVDLSDLPAALLISAFFNGYLQYFVKHQAKHLDVARATQWRLKHDFQKQNVARWMKDFKPFVPEQTHP